VASPTNPPINSSIHSILFESSTELPDQTRKPRINKKARDFKPKKIHCKTFRLARMDFPLFCAAQPAAPVVFQGAVSR
jgi:hypothetical protein